MPNTIPSARLPRSRVKASYVPSKRVNLEGGGSMPRSTMLEHQAMIKQRGAGSTSGDMPTWFREGPGRPAPGTFGPPSPQETKDWREYQDSADYVLDQQVQQLQRTYKMNSSEGQKAYQGIQKKRAMLIQLEQYGNLSPDMLRQEKLKIVLPKAVGSAAFPSMSAGAMAYMPSTLVNLEEDLKANYVKGDAPWYKGGFGRDVKSQTKVLDVYKQWQSDRGYWHPSMGQTRRAQLDELFDTNASQMTNWDWDPSSGEVRAARASQQGGLTGAASRMIDPARRYPGTSPMAEHVLGVKDQGQDAAKRAELIQRGWTEEQIDTALGGN